MASDSHTTSARNSTVGSKVSTSSRILADLFRPPLCGRRTAPFRCGRIAPAAPVSSPSLLFRRMPRRLLPFHNCIGDGGQGISPGAACGAPEGEIPRPLPRAAHSPITEMTTSPSPRRSPAPGRRSPAPPGRGGKPGSRPRRPSERSAGFPAPRRGPPRRNRRWPPAPGAG